MERRWLSQSQPQTLQMAVMLLYMLAALNVLSAVLFGGGGWILVIPVAGQVLGGFGIANDSKAGYRVAIFFSFLPLVLIVALMIIYHVLAVSVISTAMQIALVCLLLHPQSRQYARIWFR